MNWKKRKKRDNRLQARRKASSAAAHPGNEGPGRALDSVSGVSDAQKQSMGRASADPKIALLQRIADLPLLAEARVRASAASVVLSDYDRIKLKNRLELGTSEALPSLLGDIPLDAVLGIDFGTSSTKIVARLPYWRDSPSFAVPAMRFASAEHHPHMWESRLWMTSDGTFSLSPGKDSGVLCSIKANLMAPDCERRMVMHADNVSATALECAVAFLALQIRQARGWLYEKHSASFSRGPLRWHYNLGLPAAKLDDSRNIRHYQTCLAASVEIAGRPGQVSLDVVRQTVGNIRIGKERLKKLRATLQPEIAAAVAGFAQSRRRQDGLYAMIDVGAGTMDCCTFSLTAGSEGDRCPIFAADVSPLGIQPLEICDGSDALRISFSRQVNERICHVLRPTKVDKYPNSPRWKEGLPVFLVGGGSPSLVHRAEIIAIDRNMQRSHLGGLRVQDLPAPESLDHTATPDQLHRLAVAVGLSLPASDIPKVELPTSISDIGPVFKRNYEIYFVGPEMV